MTFGKLVEILEEEIETKVKGKRILHTKKIPILDANGTPQFLLGISEDITDRKGAEQDRDNLTSQLLQSQKMEAIGTLAGGICHDFNNLLQIVLGYSQIMLESKKEGDSDYSEIRQISPGWRERGAKLVQSLMAFRSRKAESQPNPINLNNQVDQLTKMLAMTIPKMIEN